MRKLLIAAFVIATGYAAVAAVPPPNIDRALAAQRALVQHQPTAERWNDLGNLLQVAGKVAEARAAYERALALDAKLVSAHYNLGLLLRQASKDHDAMEQFRQAVDLAPADAWAWFQIGSLHEAHGSEGPAVRAYARAFALDPRLSFADVNPQVIESKLVTQSLLQAQKEVPKASEAPRDYEDPRHIASLLLPQPPPAASPAATPGAPPPAATVTAPRLPADQRVLRPQDLRPGSQVGGVAGGGNGRPGATSISPDTPGYSELLRQQLELQQQQQQELEGGGGEGGMEPPPVGIYVPGTRSSGQLDQRLDQLR
ncbi:MAG TPA: tetratricopeptide repeat protein [Thermoanaerobaculia bacterium]|nr:tetratricopeptide repeat protein [Thermoanaerobaculia bacterium]